MTDLELVYKMAALIARDVRRHLKQPNRPMLLGVDLQNAKEEAFCVMVCDGLSVAAAFVRAGFTSKASNAALTLFHKPHIQARAQAILEARRTQGVVTLPEVTSMLQRVFAGALHDAEYSAAHNAAFSLARLYGHVTDRATLEVIRRPSRDPDTPSEQALSSWVEALPGLPIAGFASGPGPVEASFVPGEARFAGPGEASFVRIADAPVVPLEHHAQSRPQSPNDFNSLEPSGPVDWYRHTAGPEGPGLEKSNDFKDLEHSGTGVPGRPENGAPSRPVTGTPHSGARADLLGPEPQEPPPHRGDEEKRVPPPKQQVPVKKRVKSGAEKRKEKKLRELGIPPMEDLF